MFGLKSFRKFLKAHPTLRSAISWGVPITVAGITTYITYYYVNDKVMELKAPELDQCTGQSLASNNNIMNNCTNFVDDFICQVRNCTYYPAVNYCSDNGAITICGTQMSYASPGAFNYNCTINGENSVLKCFSAAGIKKAALDQLSTVIFFSSAAAGAAVGGIENFIQNKLLPTLDVCNPSAAKSKKKLSNGSDLGEI